MIVEIPRGKRDRRKIADHSAALAVLLKAVDRAEASVRSEGLSQRLPHWQRATVPPEIPQGSPIQSADFLDRIGKIQSAL